MTRNPPELSLNTDSVPLSLLQQLGFKVALLFLVVALSLSLLAWQAGNVLMRNELVGDAQRYQHESGLRVAQLLESYLAQTQSLANDLELAAILSADALMATARVSATVKHSGVANMVTGIGIWPQPPSADAPRRSRYWIADDKGVFVGRNDFNDPRSIPYTQEAWYSVARHALPERCHWMTVQTEPLSNRQVVGCVLPILEAGRFQGAITIWLDIIQLEKALRLGSSDQTGYTLVLDREDRLIASTGVAASKLDSQRPRNMAELAQRLPPFNDLALRLYKRHEQLLSDATQRPDHDPAQIAALRAGTRNLSAQEAESIFALISINREGATPPKKIESLLISGDTLLGEDASASVLLLSQPQWKLIRVNPAREGPAGVEHFFTQTLGLVLGALGLVLILIYAGLRAWVLRPLSRMARTLTDARTVEASLHVQLDEEATGELGVIGHWYNERIRQLRESMDRVMAQQSQLVIETGERARVDEQALRMRERANAVLTSISDAAIMVDARGLVEDMNGPAERLTGVQLRSVRGRPCSEILRLRLATQASGAPDFVAGVVASQSRIELTDGIFLQVEGRAEREIQLIGSPMRGLGGRTLGATLIFRTRETPSSAPKLVFDRRSVDPVTGLPNRSGCERRLRSLLEGSRLQPGRHALLVGDIDRLRHINETLGLQAGDAALVRVAELLVDLAPGGDVFRLGADAFALVVENSDEDSATRLAQLALESIATTSFKWADQTFSLTACFGVAVFDGTVEHPMQVIGRAEAACDAAKAQGKSTLKLYTASMDPRASAADEASWVRRIRAGLDEGMLHLTTQWIQASDARIAEGSVYEISFALEDEEGFWVQPAAFIPVAERNGLIVEVERWAVRQAFKHLSRSPAVLAQLSFSTLSLSAQTIAENGTLEMLVQEFESCPQIPASSICFVLGESVMSDVPAQAQTFSEAMRSLGCRVAIDQVVPRGAAGNELLRRVPADFLRIDARHFANLPEDPVDQIGAESMIRLAAALKRRMIVTELNSERSRDAWKRMGADYFQGPVISRASPVIFSGKP